MLGLEARSKLILFYTKFYVKRVSFLASACTAKLPAFFQRIQTEERVLRVNKNKSTGENALNGDHLGTEGNHESSNNKRNLFWVFLQICDPCFNH